MVLSDIDYIIDIKINTNSFKYAEAERVSLPIVKHVKRWTFIHQKRDLKGAADTHVVIRLIWTQISAYMCC